MPPKRRRSSSEPETAVAAVEDQNTQKDFWAPFKRHSDITLYLGPDKVPFPGHRFILKARCFHFCINEVHAKGGYVLYFEDHPVGILKLMLQYIYTGDYNIDLGTTNAQAEFGSLTDPLKIHSAVSDAASTYEYDVEGLEDICLAKMKDHILTDWNARSFCQNIRTIFKDIDFDHPELHSIVIETALEHAQELEQDPEFLSLVDFTPGFTRPLMRKLLSEYRAPNGSLS
ncbi:hypothetical protein Plec18170_002328 [Paecilomyces lecythidis]